jgi:LysM repeat protein
MKSFLVFILTITLMALGAAAQPAQARGETIYLVQVGDTLYSIALNHGLSVDELAEANGLAWNGWIYPGQQILIPTPAVGWGNQFDTPFIQPAYGMPRSAGYETPTYAYQPLPNPAYPVQPTGFSTFQNFNSVSWSGGGLNQQPYAVFSPQNAYAYRPPAWSQPLAPTMGLSLATALGEKWIDVNLTNQMVVAYEGQTPVFRAPASTGIWEYPTIAGTFSI